MARSTTLHSARAHGRGQGMLCFFILASGSCILCSAVPNWLHSAALRTSLFFQIAINRRDRGDRQEGVYYIWLSLYYPYKYSPLCERGVPGGKKLAFLPLFSDFFVLLAFFYSVRWRFTRYEIRVVRAPRNDLGLSIDYCRFSMKYERRTANYELRTTNYELRTMDSQLPAFVF